MKLVECVMQKLNYKINKKTYYYITYMDIWLYRVMEILMAVTLHYLKEEFDSKIFFGKKFY